MLYELHLLFIIPNKSLSRKETDIIHLAMGGGSKKFFDMLTGVRKSFAACKMGSIKFDAKNFQLPSPPHQSISEHSLSKKHPASFCTFVGYLTASNRMIKLTLKMIMILVL